MNKKKILVCHNYYAAPGGESHVFDNEIRGLRANGHTVITYERHNSEIEEMTPWGKIAAVPRAFSNTRTRQDLAKLIADERPDVAIVQNVFPLLSPATYPALRRAGVPVIQAVYNYRLVCPNASLFTRGAICERCITGSTVHSVFNRCYRNSFTASGWYAAILGLHRSIGTFATNIDRYLVPDRFLGTKLVAGGYPADRIRVAPNPFFAADYTMSDESDGYLLFIGRLVPQKGIMTLLDAVERSETRPRLVIVGDGELSTAIRDRIWRSGLSETVSLHGPAWGDALKRLMARACAVVVPSEWYDNLPVVVCQANASGKPVIASRINGIPEYVRAGVNGFLFEPGNATDLASVIDDVIRMPEAKLKAIFRSSRAVAEREFDYTRHYALMSEIFDELGTDVASG